MNTTKNNITIPFLFSVALIFTIFSQMLEYQQYFRPLMYVSWVILFAVAIFSKGTVTITRYMLLFIFSEIFILIHNYITSMSSSAVSLSNYFEVLLIPLFVYIVSYQAGNMVAKQLNTVLKVYCVCTVFLAIYLHVTYVPSMSSWIESEVYLYASKNSAAQIFMSAAIILLFYFKEENKIKSLLRLLCVGYLITVSLLLQCRTALLGFACVLLFYFLSQRSIKKRFLIFIVFVIVLIVIISNDNLWSVVRHALFLDRYEGADMDEFSSGRLGYWQKAIEVFGNNFWAGTGDYYVDCLYIGVFAALGIFGGIAALLPWLARMIKNFAYFREENIGEVSAVTKVVCYLTVFYLVESVLEGYPPYGPGVCSAIFWILCAYTDHPERSNSEMAVKE